MKKLLFIFFIYAYLIQRRTSNNLKIDNVLKIGIILPVDHVRPFSIQKVRPAIHLAFYSNRVKNLLPNFTFVTYSENSKCNAIAGPLAALELMETTRVHVIFGPVCDYSLAPVARYSPYWDVPVITVGGMATDFGKNKSLPNSDFRLLTRVGITFEDVAMAVYNVISQFKWKNLKVFYSADGHSEVANRICFLASTAIRRYFKDQDSELEDDTFDQKEEKQDLEDLLLNIIGNKYSIIITCNSPDSIRELMISAAKLNFVTGEYVFINLDLFSNQTYLERPWYRHNDTDENNELAKYGHESMLIFTQRRPITYKYSSFSEAVKKLANRHFNETVFSAQDEVNMFVGAFYDAALLYSYALNETLTSGYGPHNGTIVTKKMRNRTINGITGKVIIDENGDRITDYSLLDMNPITGKFEIVGNYYTIKKVFEFVPEKIIHWGGKNPYVVPSSELICGYNNALCPPPKSLPAFLIIFIVLIALTIVVVLAAILCYRDYISQKKNADQNWQIKWEQILYGTPEKPKYEIRRNRKNMKSSNLSLISVESTQLIDAPLIKTGYYKGNLVAIKRITKPFTLTKPLIYEMKKLKELHDVHLVRFIGFCVVQPNTCIVTEYCRKGSLRDVLRNNHLRLDSMFKYSLIQDIALGMSHLHASDVGSHGRLTSSNCVVDSHFVLKITDFGLNDLRENIYSIRDSFSQNKQYYDLNDVYLSPELLRMTTKRPSKGTQSADVYSFAIICQEIIYQNGPFWTEGEKLSVQEILDRVRSEQEMPFRPMLSRDSFDSQELGENIVSMVLQCWNEDPHHRPNFGQIKQLLSIHDAPDKNSDILMDNILSRLQQYAQNLESLVEEKTLNYLQQKKQAEEILYMLLPRSVAVQLMYGETVHAEKYDDVTICFCDIVGFTALSAESTPMQIVTMLNDLYTKFDEIIDRYDVYKVETIGDAYMVVSGLPLRNGIEHAAEIAKVALGLLEVVKSFKIVHRPDEQLALRTGIHSGPVCAGVVGLCMPRYCLFGDTVTTTANIQTLADPLKIHVSNQTKEKLDQFGYFLLELRGTVNLPEKGEMTTWWLHGCSEPLMSIESHPLHPHFSNYNLY